MNKIIAFCCQVSDSEKRHWLRELNNHLSDVKLLPFDQLSKTQKRQVEIAVVANPNISDLDELENLKWIQSLWSGVEKLVSEFSNKTVKIVRMIDPKLSSNMAEAILTFTLYLHRNIPVYINQQNQKKWLSHKLISANQRQIGILGLGELGKASAIKLIEHGFSVCGWSKSAKRIKGIECFDGEKGLVQILKKSEILICLLPLTNQTKNLLNKKTLSMLPKGASIINFSRGPIVSEKYLLEYLNSNHLKHAVLDVFNIEPLPKYHPFWSSTQVTVLPHISAPTDVKSASIIVANNIQKYILNGVIHHPINLERGY